MISININIVIIMMMNLAASFSRHTLSSKVPIIITNPTIISSLIQRSFHHRNNKHYMSCHVMSCHVINISPSIPTGESIGVKGVSTQSRLRYSERQLFFLRAELHDIFYIEVVIIQSCQVRDYRLLDNNNNNNNNNSIYCKYIDRSTTIINKDGGINAIYCSLHYSSHGMF